MTEFISLAWLASFNPVAAYGIALTAILLLFLRDWRGILPTLLIQYAAVGLLLTESLTLYLAFSKVMVGLFVTLMLYVTARQLYAGGWSGPRDASPLLTVPFRLVLTIILVVVAWLLAQQSAENSMVSFAMYTLFFLGGWGFISTREPLYIGLGLLMILSGVELVYRQEASPISIAFLAAAHLITVIVVAYLAQRTNSYQRPLNESF